MEASFDSVVGNTYNLYQKALNIMLVDQPSEDVLRRLHNDWDAIVRYERGMSLASEFNDRDNMEFYYNSMRAICPKIFKANKQDKNAKPENQ